MKNTMKDYETAVNDAVVYQTPLGEFSLVGVDINTGNTIVSDAVTSHASKYTLEQAYLSEMVVDNENCLLTIKPITTLDTVIFLDNIAVSQDLYFAIQADYDIKIIEDNAVRYIDLKGDK